MNIWIFLLITFLIGGITIYLGIMFSDSDSGWNKKRFYSKVWDIEYTYKKIGAKEINIENKGCLFRVRTEDGQSIESIDYSSPYSATDVYINDELVCKIHKLKNTFSMYITLEYVKERNRDEIDEIIMKTYKISKKKLNEYYKINGYGFNSKSFYNN